MKFIGVCTTCFSPVYLDKCSGYDCVLESCDCNAELSRRHPFYYYYVFPWLIRTVLVGFAYLIDHNLALLLFITLVVAIPSIMTSRKEIDESLNIVDAEILETHGDLPQNFETKYVKQRKFIWAKLAIK